MKKEIADRWIEALRSEKYEQGTGVLRTHDNKFCCLGVLCDIVKEDLKLEWKLKDNKYSTDKISVLPKEIMNYVKIETDNSYLTHRGISLAELNDYENYSFQQISNILQQYWKNI